MHPRSRWSCQKSQRQFFYHQVKRQLTTLGQYGLSMVQEWMAILVRASQMRMVLSEEPEATSLPSDEKVTDHTQSVWPSKGLRIRSPVCASQIQMVLSGEPEAILLPSGEKATDLHPISVAFQWPKNRISSLCIPNTNSLVFGARDNSLAIR